MAGHPADRRSVPDRAARPRSPASLRQTVDLIRIATDVFERHLPPLATGDAERRALVEGVLRFGREIAFAAARVYAGAAETRGAWDARLEALVVDAVVRGPEIDGGTADALVSRASALGWDPGTALRVIAGSPAPDSRPSGSPSCAGPRGGPGGRCWSACGSRLILLLSGAGIGRTPGTPSCFTSMAGWRPMR